MLGKSSWRCLNCGYVCEDYFAPATCQFCNGLHFQKISDGSSNSSSGGNWLFNLVGIIIGTILGFFIAIVYKLTKGLVLAGWQKVKEMEKKEPPLDKKEG